MVRFCAHEGFVARRAAGNACGKPKVVGVLDMTGREAPEPGKAPCEE